MKKLIAASLILWPSLAFAQANPCTGKIHDFLNHPKGAAGQVAEPAAGGSYIDPVFNTKITRVSAPSPAEGTNAIIETLYNSTRGWNADMSLIIAWHRAGNRTYEFYQGDDPYTHLAQLQINGTTPSDSTYPFDIEHIIWDSDDPTVLYYPAYDAKAGRGHPLLMKVQLHPTIVNGKVTALATSTVTIQRDFFTECQAHGVTAGMNQIGFGHSADMSYDGDRKIGLRCGTSSGVMWNFLYSITRNTIIGDGTGYISQPVLTYTTYDYPPWACPSGTCSWREAPGARYNTASFVYNDTFTHTKDLQMADVLEHSVLGYSLAGGDYVAQFAGNELPYSGNFVIWRFNGTSPIHPHVIVGQGPPYNLPFPSASSGSHPMQAAKDGSGWSGFGNLGATGTGNDGLMSNEIVLVNVDTEEVCRIAHSRSCGRSDCTAYGAPKWPYWGETHPQISNDGYRVLFNSDWENSSTVSLFVADLRPQNMTIISATIPKGVTTEAYSFAPSLTGGTTPYTCSKSAGTFPAGIGLSGTGNCTISGTPTTVESQTFTFQSCDSSGTPVCDTRAFTLTVEERPTITTTSPLTAATVGTAYAVQLIATGGLSTKTFTQSGGAMCDGLTLGTDGSISGVPLKLQTCNFVARIADANLYRDKNFALTVALPGACNPGGSGVCMKLHPGANTILARYGQIGLPWEASCTASLKQGPITLQNQTTTTGPSRRAALFSGLSPDTLYTVRTSCTNLEDVVADAATTTATVAGTKTVPIKLHPQAVAGAVSEVTVDYGTSDVSEHTTTVSCATGCTVNLTLGEGYYVIRHTWKNSSHVQLAQSSTRFLRVQ